MSTLHTLLEEGTHLLTPLSTTPRLDCELLLCHCLQKPKEYLFLQQREELSPALEVAYRSLLTRRLAHEPIAYITGTKEFFGLPLTVTPATLIPRPDTEILVEHVIEDITLSQQTEKHIQIFDVGTGSGAIALALGSTFPELPITGLDISEEALGVATQNKTTLLPESNVTFLGSDLLSRLLLRTDLYRGTVFIVANLPYIPFSDHDTLIQDITQHEPHSALFSDDEGLQHITRLIGQVEHLRTIHTFRIILHLECGRGQWERIFSLPTLPCEKGVYRTLAGLPLFVRLAYL